MSALVANSTMAKERKNSPVRIDGEALDLARIAASYKKLGISEYISLVLKEASTRDIHEEHGKLESEAKPKKAKGDKP